MLNVHNNVPSYTAYSVPYTRRQNQRFMRKMTVNLKLFLWFELKWSVAPFMEGQPRVMGKKCIYSMNSFSLHHVRGTHCILYAHIIHTYVSLCHLFYFLLKKQGLTEISYYFNSTIYLFQKKHELCIQLKTIIDEYTCLFTIYTVNSSTSWGLIHVKL